LIILSIIAYGCAIGVNVLGYLYFSKDWAGNTLWVNIVTSIMLVILPIIQLFRFNQQNSLLTTALVSLFISYLGFIAQFSYGEGYLKRTSIGSLAVDIFCSTLFFILTMCGSIMGGTGQIKITTDGNALNDAMGVSILRNDDVKSNQK
jgi:hypothetical protein